MARKKKTGKQTPPGSLSQEEQRVLSRLLEGIETLTPQDLSDKFLSPALAEGLVEELPLHDAGTPELVAAIERSFPQKTVQKAVRKKRFKLKQMGIPVAEPEPRKESAVSSVPEEPGAYVGPLDGTGSRPFLITIPQRMSGVDLAMGVISDESGVIEFLYGRYSRKRMKEIKEMLFSEVPHLVETTLSHVATVLEHAYSVKKEDHGEPAREYLRLRPWLLKNAPLLDRPAVSAHIPLNGVHPEILTETQVQRLLSHDLTASWVVAPENLQPLIRDIHKAEESPIFISEAQRREHICKIKEEGIAKVFGEKDLKILRNRLEETAYVFFRIGEETLSRLCLAASLSLDARDGLIKINFFLKALLDRSLARLPQTKRSEPLILR